MAGSLPGAAGPTLGVGPLAVAGTLGLFALFLSATAFVAARNVLGDVPAVRALGVGPLPATVAVLSVAFELPTAPAIGLAVLLDGLAIHVLYGGEPRTSAYITFIHVVVTILAGTVLLGVALLVGSRPG